VSSGSQRWRATAVASVTLLCVLLTGRLGLWQIDRASQKEALRNALVARSQMPELRSGELPRSGLQAEPMHYRNVRLQGQWLKGVTVFLDNRQMDGKVGFFVLTPLELSGDAGTVLVQRGWAPRNVQERTRLPEVRTSGGTVEVVGVLAPVPSRLFEFSHGDSGPIRQNLDMAGYAIELGRPLLPFTVLQADSRDTTGDGLLRHWTRPGIDIHKNYGYALQWFSLGALMTGLYVWFQHIRPRLRRNL
jgi:surfeit locus 1 family protein